MTSRSRPATGRWGGTTDAFARYLDPPARPDTFIQLSQSGRNFLTSDKYLDGAKRSHFHEAPAPIALGKVNYGIFPKPTPAPTEGAHVYDKEEVILPGALVAPASWRRVDKPAVHNPFMMSPAQRRMMLKQERAATEAYIYNRQREQAEVRRKYIMQRAYPNGVVGIDAPIPGSLIYADQAKAMKAKREKHIKHQVRRRANIVAKSRSVDYNILEHKW